MLTDEEFRLFRNFIREESGIYLKKSRKDFLQNRLLKRMRSIGISSPYRYYRVISNGGKDELMSLLDLLTINETSFFRNRPQIELFRNALLPVLLAAKVHNVPKRLRIWSAGCSTGEEPYTVAIVVHQTVRNLQDWNIRIYASDLSLSALGTASRAEYDEDKVTATVDDHYIANYFEKVTALAQPGIKGTGPGAPVPGAKNSQCRYRVKEEIRKLVTFDFHNLKNENGLEGLDAIFCRNVMIYFEEDEQRRLISKFHQSLNPGGYLLLGHSESLQGWTTGFEFVYENKGMAYRKKGKESK